MTNTMIAQTESLPDLIRNELKTLDSRVRNLFSHNEILSTKKIFITGCGDSYFAGLAAKLAFQEWCGIDIEVKSSLQAGRYEMPYISKSFPNNPLVFGISVSGGVSRTIEAVGIAKEMGAKTVAITANPDARLAQTADKMIDCTVPDFADSPGVRSYQVSLMVLYLVALHFAEVMGRMTMQEADALRDELLATADVIEATIADNKPKAKALAEQFKDDAMFHFVSHGPNLATAIFSSAKVIESCGRYASGQDTEEWAHLEYFNNIKDDVPTILISPGYRTHGLMAEFAKQMQRLGRVVVAVTPEDDTLVAPLAAHHLPVVGEVREELSPFVYSVAANLLAAYLSETTGQAFFRDGDPRYAVEKDHRKTSEVGLKDLK